MKSLFVSLILSLAIHAVFAGEGIREVNAVLGDKSFILAFNRAPIEGEDEQLRIQTHLSYVESILNNRQVVELTFRQRENRKIIIELLHEYWTGGRFPSNYDYPQERRPCFIDRNGNICAVGYLVEKTRSREMAEEINARHQYDFIYEMNEPSILAWAAEFGLSLEECAMIQPAYGPPTYPTSTTRYHEIETSYGISSSILGGINLATTIANFSNQRSGSSNIGYIGLLTGTAQIVLGAANIKESKSVEYWGIGQQETDSYKAQNNLSYINIAMGTTTIISSTINLLMKKKFKEARNAYNLYSYPNVTNTMTFGVSLKRRI